MLTCLLIDDEKHALEFLKRMLAPYEQLAIQGAYTDPAEALAFLERTPVDIVFLDIEMRGVSGLEVAARIGHFQAETEIVFITAHSQFAIDAFELGALDYLLKPLQRKRVDHMIETIWKRTSQRRANEQKLEPKQVTVQCFYQFHVLLVGEAAVTIRWRTQKTMELFALLLHYRGTPLSRWQLIEALWPETSPEKAAALLHTSVYYLRKVIKDHMSEIAIDYENEKYRIHIGSTEMDTIVWERKLIELPPLAEHTVQLHMDLYKQYTGDYLELHGFSWALKESERLRRLWSAHTLRLAAWLEQRDRYQESMLCYEALRARLPYMEEGHWGVMRICASLNNYSAMHELYRELEGTLRQELGLKPSAELQLWYERQHNRSGQQ